MLDISGYRKNIKKETRNGKTNMYGAAFGARIVRFINPLIPGVCGIILSLIMAVIL